MIEFYSASGCPFSQRVHSVLEHLDVSYKTVEVGGADADASFRKKCPTGVAPMLAGSTVDLVYTVLPETPRRYVGEGGRLRQILLNYLYFGRIFLKNLFGKKAHP